jgi:GAF domain-containing protein
MADPEFTWFEAQKRGGFHTGLGVPLMREGTAIGVFFLARNAIAPFSPQEIDLVTTFADQAVIAIENTRLFEEVQARNHDLTEALSEELDHPCPHCGSRMLIIETFEPGHLLAIAPPRRWSPSR